MKKNKKNKSKFRFTLDLNEAENEALEELVRDTKESKRNVLRYSLYLLHYHRELSKQGYEAVYEKPGSEEKIRPIMLGIDKI